MIKSRSTAALLRRYRYVYALFSRSGFSPQAQQFAAAHQISLVDLSGPAFRPLRQAVREAAASLVPVMTGTGRLSLMREYLRKELDTWDWSLETWQHTNPDPAIATVITDTGQRLRQNLAAYDGGVSLRNLAIGALRLAGRHDLTEATRWANRYMNRPFTILGLTI